MSNLNKYLKGDIVIWIIFIVLCLISILEVYSTSSSLAYRTDTTPTAIILGQIRFLVGGAAAVYILHLIPYKYVRILNYVLLGGIFVAILLALTIGERRLFGIQPSEFAKVSVIMFVADMLARKQQKGTPDDAFKTIAWIVLPFCALIAPLKLSSALLIAAVTVFLMLIGRVSLKKIAVFAGILLLVGIPYIIIGFNFTEEQLRSNAATKVISRAPTHAMRVGRMFVDKDKYYHFKDSKTKQPDSIKLIYRMKPHNETANIFGITTEMKNVDRRQATDALIAIAKAPAVIGMPGTSEQKHYLANAYDDYIFAIIVEENGVFAGIVVMLLYLFLLFRAGVITRRSNQAFPTLLVVGLALLIALQALVHIAVSADAFITGETLPLISKGGSAIIATCGAFGLMLSISRYLNAEEDKEDKEIKTDTEEEALTINN
ncbi:MAG: FtsW/RodA/SpoVE family cell cycle protein [Prevotellaceae bacterium]|jgi:cell division protein FtsW|nr:FtsW/RodA/SpoVE family cell cycle protein [Prevotellaceae bacterium]